jgi:hypothetical protein
LVDDEHGAIVSIGFVVFDASNIASPPITIYGELFFLPDHVLELILLVQVPSGVKIPRLEHTAPTETSLLSLAQRIRKVGITG